jgi:hypothetical protein
MPSMIARLLLVKHRRGKHSHPLRDAISRPASCPPTEKKEDQADTVAILNAKQCAPFFPRS